MRPLELTLAGFRSYRTKRTVSFRDVDLVAIIGDTGAGKSSLLEAMTWVLYGASSWSKKSTSELLAHNAKRMTVTLEFEAGGERWLVMRTYSHTGAGGAELTCLSDASIPKVDGITQVAPEVEALLGLKYEAFCSCVLLPQGKFERLLRAKKGDKTDTLKEVLRLELLSQARDVAGGMAERLGDREREMLMARGRFRPDPAGDVAAAEAELRRLGPELERLASADARLGEHDEAVAGHAERAKAARAEAERLRRRRGDRATRLADLAARAEELETRLATATSASTAAGRARETAEAEHAEAAAAGADSASLLRVQSALEWLRENVERREALRDRLAADGAEREAAEAELAGEREALSAATAALTAHAGERAGVTAAAEAAREVHRRAADAVAALRSAQEQARGAVASADEAATVSEREAAAHAARAERAAEAETAYAAAVAAQRAAQRAHAVAHVAHGLAAGDDCPVCERTLPDGFSAPSDPDQAAADEAVRAADEARRVASHEEREAYGLAAAAAERAVGLQRLAAAQADRVREREAVARAVPGLESGDPGAALVALAEQAEAAAEAVAALEPARAEREQAQHAAQTAVTRREAQLSGLARRIAEHEDAIADLDRAAATGVAALPAWCELAEPVRAEAVDGAVALATERRRVAGEREQELERVRARAQAAGEAAAAIGLELERDVRTPAAAARAQIEALAAELPDDARDELRVPAANAATAELAAFATALEQRVDSVVTALDEQAADAEGRMAAERAAANALLAEIGFADRAALVERRDGVRAEEISAKRELAAASAQLGACERLDGLLARTTEMHRGFTALKAALLDGAFVGYVVARRQRALLAYASSVLQDITGRYAFTDDFRILDRDSGLPRSADTLSGGETFIASLALALGLVEVADRSGGDLRALFLDEGFGTLDAATLDTALTALEERARAGRLIGLISHVPTVAERIDTVLEISNAVDGSDVRLLTGAERAERVLDAAADAAAAAL